MQPSSAIPSPSTARVKRWSRGPLNGETACGRDSLDLLAPRAAARHKTLNLEYPSPQSVCRRGRHGGLPGKRSD
jgi:hypothetical protein